VFVNIAEIKPIACEKPSDLVFYIISTTEVPMLNSRPSTIKHDIQYFDIILNINTQR